MEMDGVELWKTDGTGAELVKDINDEKTKLSFIIL